MSKNTLPTTQNDQTCSVNLTDQVPLNETKISNRVVYQFFNDTCIKVHRSPEGEAIFIASEIAEFLGYADPDQAIHKHCKDIRKIAKNDGFQTRYVLAIGEPDLYRLIIRSKKPEAQEFERWVMEEVLPQVRRTGKYKVTRKLTPNEEGQAILEEAQAKQAQQMELFPEKLVLRFPEEPVNKLREARARLAEDGTTFESHEDFIGYVIEKGLEAL